MFRYNLCRTNRYPISNSNNTGNTENKQYNFGKINGKWTDAQRRIVWMLLVKARAGLKIEIDPVVATAFVILQKYFRNLDEQVPAENNFVSDYDLLTLMTAALFTVCKRNDKTIRSWEFIYNEISKICLNAPSQKVRLILGSRINSNYPNQYFISKFCENDYEILTRCEIDLLDASCFDIDLELPFRYYNDILIVLSNLLPRDSMSVIYNTWLIDTCLMICSQYYLDLPPEVAAAAAVADSFQNRPSQLSLNNNQQRSQPQLQFQHLQNDMDSPFGIATPDDTPQYIIDWVDGVKERHGDKLFQLAQHAILEERQRTIPQSIH